MTSPGIDQHPIALGLPLDAGAAKTFIFELSDDVIGNGPDMPLRAPRCQHHVVADRGLTLQVDADDIFRLAASRVSSTTLSKRAG